MEFKYGLASRERVHKEMVENAKKLTKAFDVELMAFCSKNHIRHFDGAPITSARFKRAMLFMLQEYYVDL